MKRLHDHIADAGAMSRDAFAQARAGRFLLQFHPVSPDEPERNQATRPLPLFGSAITDAFGVRPRAASQALFLYALTQNPGERASLGRALTNDIVIADSSVSKVHAYLTRLSASEDLLTDAGSRNGSRVNGRILRENETINVSFGDTLVLGDATLLFVDAPRLWDALRATTIRAG